MSNAKQTIDIFSRKELYQLMWSRPSFAQLEITQNCNQSCVFCFDGCEERKQFSDLSTETWKQILLDIARLGIHTLHFSGGEIFLFKGYLELFKYAKEMNFSIYINTNGTIDISQSLPYVDQYFFSVHGVESMHDEIVRKSGAFSLTCKNIQRANEYNVPADVHTVLIRQNFKSILEIYNYFEEHYKIRKYAFTLAAKSISGSDFTKYDLMLSPQMYHTYLEALRTIGRERLTLKHGMYTMLDYDTSFDPPTSLPMPICAAGKDKIIIKHNGDVYPCRFLQTDDFLCGNVLKEDILSIWENGKGYVPFRQLILENQLSDKCKSCLLHLKCFGGCRLWTNSYRKKGIISYENDFRCEYDR